MSCSSRISILGADISERDGYVTCRCTVISGSSRSCSRWSAVILAVDGDIARAGDNRCGNILNGDNLYAGGEVRTRIGSSPCPGDSIVVVSCISRISILGADISERDGYVTCRCTVISGSSRSCSRWSAVILTVDGDIGRAGDRWCCNILLR